MTNLVADALASEQLDEAIALMRGARVAVLTGAGVSTDSGIPDYRGEGAPRRSPMTFQTFLASEHARKRYWAGSHLGWRHFGSARPNAGHRALAGLEAAGAVTGLVTQNVDGLHRRAGSAHVVELHGTMDRVVCLACGQYYARQAIADRLEALNPGLDPERAVRLAPDGDAEVDDIDAMRIPDCTVCGGILKPDVVFFGEFVPGETFEAARSIVAGADVLLVAGSSLVVNSGIRLIEQARRRNLPIIVINRGVTKGDGRAAVKLDAGTTETLTAMAAALA
ncbi:NAD-dependent protein deacetylase [Agromyces aerolatus]|uniref:NAD-dependent protein deacetylase n=1 Tax=Agromyces sp. LY-1074 TaxID=3074080 RepID=UPI00286036AC|nr:MULTISPECIES: NAD-dependent protein deacetylase [unclassified Agromyces]MDR5700073.1 NAD-dependent protein deacetylase [Agromyces sp. LY-1074]MDR5706559.1 NAD-dependent protein deacetylase [Agromyces sp. LY-1358]